MFSNQNDNRLINKLEFEFHSSRILRYLFDKGIIFLSFKVDCSFSDWDRKPLSEVDSLKEAKELIKYSVSDELFAFDLLEVVIATIKKNTESAGYSVYFLLGYRPLIDFNESVFYRIREYFLYKGLTFFKHLEFCDDLINFFKLMANDIFRGLDFYNFYMRVYSNIDRAESIYEPMSNFLCNEVCYSKERGLNNFDFFEYKHHDSHIEGLNLRTLQDRSTILLNLIRIFMQENKMFLHNGVIFQRFNNNTFIKKVVELDNFFLISEEIIAFLYHRFAYQLEPSILRTLFLEHSASVINKIKVLPSFLPQLFDNNYSIDFSEGLAHSYTPISVDSCGSLKGSYSLLF